MPRRENRAKNIASARVLTGAGGGSVVDVWIVELHSNKKLNGNGYKNNNKL